ncbi:hypothetical protein [Streptomyces sp. S063]|uniref:hypothetical protein n=1 Tax=Streptomyces sp. S063 TaxID=2005885 RepID=UPI001F2DDFF5|nr:hypothetical protein [Streptomyces sp. S063]
MTLVQPGSGSVQVEQGTVRSAVAPDDIYFIDTSKPYEVATVDAPIRGIGLDLPGRSCPCRRARPWTASWAAACPAATASAR